MTSVATANSRELRSGYAMICETGIFESNVRPRSPLANPQRNSLIRVNLGRFNPNSAFIAARRSGGMADSSSADNVTSSASPGKISVATNTKIASIAKVINANVALRSSALNTDRAPFSIGVSVRVGVHQAFHTLSKRIDQICGWYAMSRMFLRLIRKVLPPAGRTAGTSSNRMACICA